MIQEVITYIIISLSITLAAYKIYQNLKSNKSETPFVSKMHQKGKNHVCSDCSAECMLRDLTPSEMLQNESSCKTLKKNLH